MESLCETPVLKWSESHDLECRNGSPLIKVRYSYENSQKNSAFELYSAEEQFLKEEEEQIIAAIYNLIY